MKDRFWTLQPDSHSPVPVLKRKSDAPPAKQKKQKKSKQDHTTLVIDLTSDLPGPVNPLKKLKAKSTSKAPNATVSRSDLEQAQNVLAQGYAQQPPQGPWPTQLGYGAQVNHAPQVAPLDPRFAQHLGYPYPDPEHHHQQEPGFVQYEIPGYAQHNLGYSQQLEHQQPQPGYTHSQDPRYAHPLEYQQQPVYLQGQDPRFIQQHDHQQHPVYAPSSQPAVLFDARHPTHPEIRAPPNTASITGYVASSSQAASAPKLVAPVVPVDPEPDLCAEQRALVDIILSGQSVFYTGSAGCGKSTVLKAFVKELRDKRGKDVRIVAPTGRAAVDIGGQTVHAYAGITPDSMKLPLLDLKQRAWGKVLYKRLTKTDVLVIDEISMVENHFLERLSEMLKTARGSDLPFGGVQVVFLGDFYQLPPVKPFQYCITCGKPTRTIVSGKLYKCAVHGEFRDDDKWAFRSKCWQEANLRCVNLTSIHRQSDPVFIGLLEKCRQGRPFSEQEKNLLMKHPCNVKNAVQLYATRDEVKRINDGEFAKLRTKSNFFKCLDGIQLQEHHKEALKWKATRNPDGSLAALKDHRFESQLNLKQNMQVILLVNLDLEAGLINGSQGVLCGWEKMTEGNLPVSNEKVKSKPGEAANRPLLFGDFAATKEAAVKQFFKTAETKSWPIVKFDNGVTRTIIAECTVSELGDQAPYSMICRTQIPLLPAWAMSIHKSQGMTLSKVIVDLSKNFESGQVYVALSRAKSLDGLKVMGLGESQSGPDHRVMAFLEESFGRR